MFGYFLSRFLFSEMISPLSLKWRSDSLLEAWTTSILLAKHAIMGKSVLPEDAQATSFWKLFFHVVLEFRLQFICWGACHWIQELQRSSCTKHRKRIINVDPFSRLMGFLALAKLCFFALWRSHSVGILVFSFRFITLFRPVLTGRSLTGQLMPTRPDQ